MAIQDDISSRLAAGLGIALLGIILGWLWLQQQQIMKQQVTDSEMNGKLTVLESKFIALKETGSISAQQTVIDVKAITKILETVATKDDILRLEKRMDRELNLKK